MIIYGLKNCATCRAAMKALPLAELRDVRADGVPDDVLRRAEAQFGRDLVNTRSTTWRGLDATERSRETLPLLKDHPTLMKRPLVEAGDKLFLGWNRAVEEQLEAMR